MLKKSINAKVWELLRKDLAIQKDIIRKLINVRALAKKLIKENNLNASLDAVISALRRFQSDETFEKEEKLLRSIFRNSTVRTQNNMCCFTFNSPELLKIFSSKKRLSHSRMVIGTNTLKLMTRAHHKNSIKNLVSKNDVEKVEEDLSEISIIVAQKAIQTKGVLARMASEMALANVNIYEIIICPPEFLIYIKQKDIVKAHESILKLCLT